MVQPTVKTSISVSNPQRTLRTKRTSAMDKSISTVATSTGRKDESVTSSLLDNIPVVVSHEAIQEPSFDSNSKSTANKLDAIVQRKSDRRRSYTSSLMARSKVGPHFNIVICSNFSWNCLTASIILQLLVEHGEVIKQEKVPCIDDNCNQLEVAEYVDDIYQFYWVSEVIYYLIKFIVLHFFLITPYLNGLSRLVDLKVLIYYVSRCYNASFRVLILHLLCSNNDQLVIWIPFNMMDCRKLLKMV